MSHVAVIGAGYVGLSTALGLAELGHEVRLIERDENRYAALLRGVVPVNEPEMLELLTKHLGSSLIIENTDSQLTTCKYVFICVSTPSATDGSTDLTAVYSVFTSLEQDSLASHVWILKSSIPPGTTQRLCRDLGLETSQVVCNPEFLREGHCIEDFMKPDRIVIGSEDTEVVQELKSLYSDIKTKVIVCSPTEAELIKYASNSALAVKLTFANEISDLCDAMNIDVNTVLSGVGSDTRIGIGMLAPGPGWGGSCLPKDTRALVHASSQLEVSLSMVKAAINSNSVRAQRIAQTLIDFLGRSNQENIAVWGLTFKAETDDLRESPALEVIALLLNAGIKVTAFDPAVQKEAHIDSRVEIADSAIEACKHSQLLVVMTEWSCFRKIEVAEITDRTILRTVLDTRGILDQASWKSAGFKFLTIGR